MIIGGIDYSMTSPAVCVHTGEEWDIKNCNFLFISQNAKKFEGQSYLDGQIQARVNPTWENNTERFTTLMRYTSQFLILENNCYDVGLEDYAFAAKGMVFTIGENTGLLKYMLIEQKVHFDVYSPGTIKKFAVQKGNANKFLMLEQFVKETGWELDKYLELKITDASIPAPITDIVDAYFICKHHHSIRVADANTKG